MNGIEFRFFLVIFVSEFGVFYLDMLTCFRLNGNSNFKNVQHYIFLVKNQLIIYNIKFKLFIKLIISKAYFYMKSVFEFNHIE